MRFRTELKPEVFPFILDPEKPVVTLGSCFADNIAKRMRDSLWRAENPFGTLFNPFSISKALRLVLTEDSRLFEESIFFDGNLFHSWNFGSSFSSVSKQETIKRFEKAKYLFHNFISQSQTLFITFGTARVWSLNSAEEEMRIVGNCHKQHPSLFSSYLISINGIVTEWTETLSLLKNHYPKTRIIFTVSPVRHLSNGFHDNTLSKSTLHLAISELIRSNTETYYFPAYELLNDDLRDYRFYESDLVHPSEAGVEYIWEYFKSALLDEKGRKRLREGEKERKRSQHRPLIH